MIPGLTDKIASACFFKGEFFLSFNSSIKCGRGPTTLKSPFRTLKNWGNSSRDVFLKNVPMGVIRGSFSIF